VPDSCTARKQNWNPRSNKSLRLLIFFAGESRGVRVLILVSLSLILYPLARSDFVSTYAEILDGYWRFLLSSSSSNRPSEERKHKGSLPPKRSETVTWLSTRYHLSLIWTLTLSVPRQHSNEQSYTSSNGLLPRVCQDLLLSAALLN
jgi:hypothetical protein